MSLKLRFISKSDFCWLFTEPTWTDLKFLHKKLKQNMCNMLLLKRYGKTTGHVGLKIQQNHNEPLTLVRNLGCWTSCHWGCHLAGWSPSDPGWWCDDLGVQGEGSRSQIWATSCWNRESFYLLSLLKVS